MILLTERIESQLRGCFQKQIQLVVRDRKIAAGKLILFRIDGFYIVLTIQTATGCDTVEIPYPFNIIENSNKVGFDYRLESLSEKDYNLLFVLQSISKRRESKFYNSILEIIQT
jgi:hypothetical protein